jgi:hypothetical protein
VTTPFLSELPVSLNTVLAGIASVLLLFVSGGVLYLTAIDWRDRRRRKAQERSPRS